MQQPLYYPFVTLILYFNHKPAYWVFRKILCLQTYYLKVLLAKTYFTSLTQASSVANKLKIRPHNLDNLANFQQWPSHLIQAVN